MRDRPQQIRRVTIPLGGAARRMHGVRQVAIGTATDRASVNSDRAAIYCATDGLNFTARLGMKFKISCGACRNAWLHEILNFTAAHGAVHSDLKSYDELCAQISIPQQPGGGRMERNLIYERAAT